MSDEPHGSTTACDECGNEVHTDVARNDEHFKVTYAAEMDHHGAYAVLCSADCVSSWARSRVR